MSENIISINDANFDEHVLHSQIPVIVDFWAAWCGPCRALAPVFEEVAQSHHQQVKFVKIDIDANPNTPSKYGVMSIPTLLLFSNGEVVGTKVGAMTKSQLIAFIEGHI